MTGLFRKWPELDRDRQVHSTCGASYRRYEQNISVTDLLSIVKWTCLGWLAALLSRLELQLKRIQGLCDLPLDHLKRFYNWQSVAEGYAQCGLDVHAHGEPLDVGVFCARYRQVSTEKIVVRDDHEIIVLVEVAQSLKVRGPLISVVRLQPLDSCDMHFGNPSEVPIALSLELVRRAFDRELNMRPLGPGIEFEQSRGQVVEGASQAIAHFPNKNGFPGTRYLS